jgi:hypothetical protein
MNYAYDFVLTNDTAIVDKVGLGNSGLLILVVEVSVTSCINSARRNATSTLDFFCAT